MVTPIESLSDQLDEILEKKAEKYGIQPIFIGWDGNSRLYKVKNKLYKLTTEETDFDIVSHNWEHYTE